MAFANEILQIVLNPARERKGKALFGTIENSGRKWPA
jgi:hypothetical protein